MDYLINIDNRFFDILPNIPPNEFSQIRPEGFTVWDSTKG